MNKKLFSKFAMLALVVGIVGVFAAARVMAAVPTSTQVNNVAPIFTVDPSDGGSDGTTPTNVGANVTFTATATDANLDGYYLAVCKGNHITAGSGGAAPTCPDGAWAVSLLTTQGTGASVTYTALSGDAESNAWYAFACDNNTAGALCSTMSQGSTSPSPFKVNHAGTFGTVTVTNTSDNASISPNDSIKFKLVHASALTDSDTDTTQDTMSMYICTSGTSGFDYSAHTCTGGSEVCHVTGVNPTSTDASCQESSPGLASIPTAWGTYHFKVYVEDMHNFAATGTSDQTYNVIDVAPTLGSWTTTDSVNGTIAAGGSDTMDFGVDITDNNGDMDVTAVEGAFFNKDNTSATCVSSPNEANCYTQTTCTLSGQSGAGTGKTALGTDANLHAACSVTVYYNALAGSNWEFHVNPTDSGTVGKVTSLSDTDVNKVVASLSGIGIIEGSIAYGTVAIGGTSTYSTSTLTTMQNMGNTVVDVLLSGTDMSSGSYTIPAGQQHYNSSAGSFSWDGGTNLKTSASAGTEANGCLNRDLAVQATHHVGTTATEDQHLSWEIKIPASQQSGSYTGSNTFATIASNQCTGTLNQQ